MTDRIACALCAKTVRSVYSLPSERGVKLCAKCFFKVPPTTEARLSGCAACSGRHTSGSGRPNGVDCRCGRHFHFGDDLWTSTDKCIVCPACGHALSPLDFDTEGCERAR